jgi:hypothetical protein
MFGRAAASPHVPRRCDSPSGLYEWEKICGVLPSASVQTRRVLLRFAFAALLAMALSACSSPLSFVQLSQQAHGVPLPPGIVYVKEQRSVENGPGFTSDTFKEVTLTYSNTLPCLTLQQRWLDALRKARRSFRLVLESHLYGGSGQAEIDIRDRPGHLGVTLGSITNGDSYIECKAPFIWSFN